MRGKHRKSRPIVLRGKGKEITVPGTFSQQDLRVLVAWLNSTPGVAELEATAQHYGDQ